MKRIILWVDFLANGPRLVKKEAQQELLEKAERAGVTDIVIDGKVPYGQTTFYHASTHHISTLAGYEAWKGRDFIAEWVDMATNSCIRTHVNMNIFAEGMAGPKQGIAFDHPDWQATLIGAASSAHEYDDSATVFVDPNHLDVVQHELDVLSHVATTYEIEGIILDRCRYPNVYGDVSDRSRLEFEDFLGHKVTHFPDDIVLKTSDGPLLRELFPLWAEWRARNIQRFVREATALVRKHGLGVANYVGSWYPVYFGEGVNWASKDFRPTYEWTSDTFHEAAIADFFDFMMTGCYYHEVTEEEAKAKGKPEWQSVTGAAKLSKEAFCGNVPFLASVFVKDYKDDAEQFRRALEAALKESDGVMIFDTVYLDGYQYWSILEEVNKEEVTR
ncbi:hypothetical protein FLK61_40315 [Paenalkalicoccus suaedae]|uniref:DUF4985 domain-containing protein n=1 Tax=Paenalkalicoccus suaedae TaxID=2592382 RepID=A0A859FIB1_9BACI|nr:alpha amylase family protein [Paenalkalicoccus suaedae]QKS72851.1 hypothetical protein FLK61_40315 [Paenalkalicoccus suaedae]